MISLEKLFSNCFVRFTLNNFLKYSSLFLIPLLLTTIYSDFIIESEAVKASGKSASAFGSKTRDLICGFNLCSEIPGGRAAYEESLKASEPVPRKTIETETIEPETIEPDTPISDPVVISPKNLSNGTSLVSDFLRLSLANIPTTLPLHEGFYNGDFLYYIITDSSNKEIAEFISKNQKWRVELAPPLANAPDSAVSKVYSFTNGPEGDGIYGFQGEVFTNTPNDPEQYSALTKPITVTWNDENISSTLVSEKEILQAKQNRLVTLTESDIVLNMPQIVWPDGQMPVKKDKTITDDMPYGGGQVIDIDLEEKTVTFIAHRGWGPDGRTIYYIVTDATPSDPATMMGVISSPTSANLIANSAASDLFQFQNGIAGSGPFGFQPGIAASAPGDDNYTPLWRIYLINWNDLNYVALLENTNDIDVYESDDLINVEIARPMNRDHIVNCPFIDPFQ